MEQCSFFHIYYTYSTQINFKTRLAEGNDLTCSMEIRMFTTVNFSGSKLANTKVTEIVLDFTFQI